MIKEELLQAVVEVRQELNTRAEDPILFTNITFVDIDDKFSKEYFSNGNTDFFTSDLVDRLYIKASIYFM